MEDCKGADEAEVVVRQPLTPWDGVKEMIDKVESGVLLDRDGELGDFGATVGLFSCVHRSGGGMFSYRLAKREGLAESRDGRGCQCLS